MLSYSPLPHANWETGLKANIPIWKFILTAPHVAVDTVMHALQSIENILSRQTVSIDALILRHRKSVPGVFRNGTFIKVATFTSLW